MGEVHQLEEENLQITAKSEENKYRFTSVNEFLYFGVLISENVHEELEIKVRIVKGIKKYGMQKSLMKSKLTLTRIKIRIYGSVIRTTVRHACETLTFNKSEVTL